MINPTDILSGQALDAASAAASAKSQLAGNFQTFLTLLTTQLQYQDPLSPMDSNEFTAQLVQFAGVEQSIATNKNLESLVNFALANTTSSAVGYIGREVTAGGETATLSGSGSVRWSYELPRAAASVEIKIVNATGNTVYTGQGAPTQGNHTFDWDGRTSTGAAAPPGTYKIAINAKDAAGNAIAVAPLIKGVVTSVDIDDGMPLLNVGGVSLKLADILSIGVAPPPAPSSN